MIIFPKSVPLNNHSFVHSFIHRFLCFFKVLEHPKTARLFSTIKALGEMDWKAESYLEGDFRV